MTTDIGPGGRGDGATSDRGQAGDSRPRKSRLVGLEGLLVVDKPVGWSSMEVVRRVRRAASGVKTGHTGTLDPLATGVLVCCLGKATKRVGELMGMTKIYEADVDLSAFTATDDREGERTEVEVVDRPGVEKIGAALEQLTGEIEQRPPAYSAVHVDGKRAYRLAREGKSVVIPSRKVRVDAIEMLGYEWPVVRLRVTCGKGTYIRSLARDLGKLLGTGGHLASLRRTAVGRYGLAMAVTEERLKEPIGQADLISCNGAL